MLKKLSRIALAMIIASPIATAYAMPKEQVWEATHTNTQQVCGIDYSGSRASGQILTKGEQGTDSDKAISFKMKANTRHMTWKITEAKIVDNSGQFDFDDDLLKVSQKDLTSLYVNNVEYDWTSVRTDQVTNPKATLKLAPKINLDATEFPLGTTKIQGKIVVTCTN